MGDIYKQVGGWKGIQKDILFPLAEYQKSQGMDTSFTRLYDAYRKVDPIWRKLHEEKDPPRVGMGDLRVIEGVMGGGASNNSGKQAIAGIAPNLSFGEPNPVLPEAGSGFDQPFAPYDYHRELTTRLPEKTWSLPQSVYGNEESGSYDPWAKVWQLDWNGEAPGGYNSPARTNDKDWFGSQGEIRPTTVSYNFRGEGKGQSLAMPQNNYTTSEVNRAGFLEPAAKAVKEWWLDVDKYGDRVYKTAVAQGKTTEQAERARNKAMKHYRGYKSIALAGSAAAKTFIRGWKGDAAAAAGILFSPDDTIKDDTEAWAIKTCDEDDEEQMKSIGLP